MGSCVGRNVGENEGFIVISTMSIGSKVGLIVGCRVGEAGSIGSTVVSTDSTGS